MSTSLRKRMEKPISHYNEPYHCIRAIKNEKTNYFLKTLNSTEWAATSPDTTKNEFSKDDLMLNRDDRIGFHYFHCNARLMCYSSSWTILIGAL